MHGRRLRGRVLASALECDQRFDQPHARIPGLELQRLVDTRADAPASERHRAHFAAGERAGGAERIGFGALMTRVRSLVEAEWHLGQGLDGMVDFLAAIVDGIAGLGLLRDAEHLREPVVRQCAEIRARDEIVTRGFGFALDRLWLQRIQHAVERARVIRVVGVLDAPFYVAPIGPGSRGHGLRHCRGRDAGGNQNCNANPENPSPVPLIHHNSRRPAVMGSRAARMPGSMPAMKQRMSP